MKLPEYEIEYDEEIDVVCSLELLVEIIPKLITHPNYWKWTIISIHSAFQGLMVLALKGTNDINVMKMKSAKEWQDHYEKGIPLVDLPEMDPFLNLYKKIKDDKALPFSNGIAFIPNASQDDSVRKLNGYRNDLIHYLPASSLFNVKNWIQYLQDVIKIMKFLVEESNTIHFFNEKDGGIIRSYIGLTESEFTEISNYYLRPTRGCS